jgi:hypothetical protein
VSNSSDAEPAEAAPTAPEIPDLDPDGIVQPPKRENPEPKPKLVGRKLSEMPMQVKGADTSGLCSIM